MKKFLLTIIIFSFYFTPSHSDGHKTKFKDIKGFKKQFISMHKKKINRIKEVKKSDGYPVYEGETSIQFTVNREDAGCGTGKAQTTQIQCDGKGKWKGRMPVCVLSKKFGFNNNHHQEAGDHQDLLLTRNQALH